MTLTNLSKKLRLLDSKSGVLFQFVIIVILFTFLTFQKTPTISALTLKSVKIILGCSIVYMMAWYFLKSYTLAKQLKNRIKHIVCDEIYFCFDKKRVNKQNNFFVIIRNNKTTALPYEYYQVEKETCITMTMITEEDQLIFKDRVYDLIKVK